MTHADRTSIPRGSSLRSTHPSMKAVCLARGEVSEPCWPSLLSERGAGLQPKWVVQAAMTAPSTYEQMPRVGASASLHGPRFVDFSPPRFFGLIVRVVVASCRQARRLHLVEQPAHPAVGHGGQRHTLRFAALPQLTVQ